MTEEMVRFLMGAGLSKTQATSVTAETAVRVLMQDEGKALIKEAERQVQETRQLVDRLKQEYRALAQKIESVSRTLDGIVSAQEEYGRVDDEKAKNVVALYAALLSMNEKIGTPPEKAAESVGHILYAYLGGQAKREITYVTSEDD